jgi:hypothetical protein
MSNKMKWKNDILNRRAVVGGKLSDKHFKNSDFSKNVAECDRMFPRIAMQTNEAIYDYLELFGKN